MSQRQDFVRQALQEDVNVSQLCSAYGISRKTGYKWLARYQQAGEAGLAERSRRPHYSPRRSAEAIEQAVVAARQAHPAWGARKLKRWLEDQGQCDVPTPSTLTAILRRHGLLDGSEALKHRPYQRFAMAAPNHLWQMDFKGDFALDAQQRCYPLTVLDDHSRFLLGLRACPDQREATVREQVTLIFRCYGLPERMLMDNGAPWGDAADTRHTRFTVWLLRLGIGVSHGRPYHPQTQGKDERLHRTLGVELLSRVSSPSLDGWQQHFDAWRQQYNQQRPHEALHLATPSSHYRPSEHPFPETLPPIVYPEDDAVRKVDRTGRICFQGRRLRVGKPFVGLPVALRPDEKVDGLLHVHFCHSRVRTLDLRALH